MPRRAPLDTLDAAYDEAVRLLTRKARSAREVAEALEARGAAREDIASVLDRLRSHRHLDDAELASDEAFTLIDSKGWAPQAAVLQLEARGIASVLAQEAVDSVVEGRSETELCEAALRRRLRSRALADAAKEGRALARLGYDADVIERVLERAARSDGTDG